LKAIKPNIANIESLFNETIQENGLDGVFFKLAFPNESLDPEKEEEKWARRWQLQGIPRDKYLAGIGLEPVGGEEGAAYYSGKGDQEGDEGGDLFGGHNTKVPVSGNKIDVLHDPVDVLKNPVPVKAIEPTDLQKAFEEDKHPRSENGEFAPEGGGQSSALNNEARPNKDPTGKISWNAKGIGGVPFQQEDAYHGEIKMSPERFLELTPSMEGTPDSSEYLEQQAKDGKTIAPPWLDVEWDDQNKIWRATNHEGRHRALAALRMGETSMPVHLLWTHGMRTKDVTDEMLHAPIMAQKIDATGALIKYSGVEGDDEKYYGLPVLMDFDAKMPKQGANDSFVVGIGDSQTESRPGVWKPASGEDEKLKAWVGGDLYCRAEAVYLIDRELAPDSNHYLVPVTFTTTVDGEEGSVQHYVTGNQPKQDVKDYDPKFIEQAAVLDYITNQMDRNHKNYLTHPDTDNRPILIDSDCSFPKAAKMHSSFIDYMRGKPLSSQMIDSIFLLINNRDLWQDLTNLLHDPQLVHDARERAIHLYERRSIDDPAPAKVGAR
jgi:hypothetical protein